MSHERPAGAEAGRSPGADPTPSERRDREARLAALRERRTDLEVERIVAGSALRATRTDAGPDVSGADAAAIVDALDRLRRLESRQSAHRAFAGAGIRSHEERIECLRAGDDALGAWLEGDRDDAGARGRRVARGALLAVCLALLVLLVPVGGAMSFLLWTGQDRAWRRMGARRRFERLGLEAPAAWAEGAVHERRRSLAVFAEQVREHTSASPGECAGDDAEIGDPRAGIDAARSDLHDALSAAGLGEERLDGPAEAALRAIARVYRAEQALQDVMEEMAGEREDAGALEAGIERARRP